jgi:hypothetical protein
MKYSRRVEILKDLLGRGAEDPSAVLEFCTLIDEDFPAIGGFVHGGASTTLSGQVKLMDQLIRPVAYKRWKGVVETFKLSSDNRILKKIVTCGQSWVDRGCPLFEEFLDCIPINSKSTFHKFLLGRACSETMTFGTLNIVDQLRYAISKNS